MPFLHRLIARLRSIRRRAQLDRDLEEELQGHLALKQRYYEAQGMPREEAARRARLALGNTTRWKERTALVWSFPGLESLWRDVVFGTRILVKDRLFTAVALLTLTLGIGANTAVFSLLNALLWRNLPVRAPEQLVRIRIVNLPPTDRAWVKGRATTPHQRTRLPFALLHALRNRDLFQGVFGTAGHGSFIADVGGEAHKLQVCTVTGSYFPVLGVDPRAGRLLAPSDDVPGGPSTGWGIVVSDAAWGRLFHRRADAIGARIVLERVPFTVIGVAPRAFRGVNPGVETDAWMPVSAYEAMFPKWRWRSDPGVWMLEMMARLEPGMDIEHTRQRVAAMSVPLLREVKPAQLSGDAEKHYLAMKFDLRPAASGYSHLVESFGPALWTLMGAVSAVLFIAATNLTNLLLARATARRQEIAVRLALGASLHRVRRQLLIESALLVAIGTAAGVVCARWLAAALAAAAAGPAGALQLDAPVDWNVLAFAVAVLAAVVLIAGGVPAWSAVRGEIHAAVKQRATSRLAARIRSGLVVVQIGVSLALLGGSGLLIASLRSVFREATGFDAAHTVFITPDLFNAGLGRERMPQAYANVLDEMRRLPGVRGAAWTMHVPLTGGLQAFTIELPDSPGVPARERMAFAHQVTDGYFAAGGIPIIAGKDFPPRGSASPKGSIVSRNLAVKFFGSAEAALGRRLKPGGLDWTEIIGVAADAKFQDVREPAPPTVYTSYWDQKTTLGMTLVINHTGPANPLVSAANALFRRQCGRTPFTKVATLAGNISQTLATERLLTGLLTAFAVFALLISATGIAGLLGYTVELKRREIGVRVALGATPRTIAAGIERHAMLLVLPGLALGAALGWPLRRAIEAHLYGVRAGDPAVWIAACALTLLCAAAAGAMPAWRAARADPMSVLRVE